MQARLILASVFATFSMATAADAQTALPTSRPYALDRPMEGPRWPAGARYVFDSYSATNRPAGKVFPGTIAMATEGGATPPYMFRGGWHGPRVKLDDDNVRAVSRRIANWGYNVVGLDFEMWAREGRRSPDEAIETSNQWYRRAFALFREGNPNVVLGAYAWPNKNYWDVLTYAGALESKAAIDAGSNADHDIWRTSHVFSRDPAGKWQLDPKKPAVIAYETWRRDNDRWSWGYDANGKRDESLGTVDAADILMPDCYLLYNRAADGTGTEEEDLACDAIYLRHNIAEAKRVARDNGNKPVAVYMMVTHPEHTTRHTAISDRRWDAMLNIIAEEDVHLIIWGRAPVTDYVSRRVSRAVEIVSRDPPAER